jgi:serine/threonine protein kinase
LTGTAADMFSEM